jgi:hypothetical protein
MKVTLTRCYGCYPRFSPPGLRQQWYAAKNPSTSVVAPLSRSPPDHAWRWGADATPLAPSTSLSLNSSSQYGAAGWTNLGHELHKYGGGRVYTLGLGSPLPESPVRTTMRGAPCATCTEKMATGSRPVDRDDAVQTGPTWKGAEDATQARYEWWSEWAARVRFPGGPEVRREAHLG